jgi:hypothetical protein
MPIEPAPFAPWEEARVPARRVFVTDENGEVRLLESFNALKGFLATLTPEELQQFKNEYRFTHITNKTGNVWYAGSIHDLL